MKISRSALLRKQTRVGNECRLRAFTEQPVPGRTDMLYPLFLNNQGPIIHKWLHYFPVYERHLKDYINKSIVLFEIGVDRGGSLQMWEQYLGPFALIVGLDNNPECACPDKSQRRIRIGDQADVKFLQRVVTEFGNPDIVIDDGSHIMADIHASFDFLYPLLNNNGLYIVEDLHTAYWDEYGGGWRKRGSFIERAKGLVDYLNAYHCRIADKANEFSASAFSICFYDSMVVFEKRCRRQFYSAQSGNPNL